MKKYTMEHTVFPQRRLVIYVWAVGLMQHCLTYTLKIITTTCMHWRTCQSFMRLTEAVLTSQDKSPPGSIQTTCVIMNAKYDA